LFLQVRDEFGAAQGPAGERPMLQSPDGSQFLGFGQQRSPPLDTASGGVKLPVEPSGRGADAEMRGSTGPLVLLGSFDQVRAYGVAFDVAQRDPEVRLVEGARIEAALKEMTHATAARIQVERVAAVSAAQSDGQGGGLIWDGYQMNVIGHQTIGKDTQAGLCRVCLQTVKIRKAVRVGEEDALVVDAALGDVMRQTDGHGASESCHMLNKWRQERISLLGPYLSVPVFSGIHDTATQITQRRLAMHDTGQTGSWYLASQTGGLMIPESNNIAASISQIYADTSSYYVLGFHPPEETFDRAANGRPFFRRITVRVKQESLQVRARSGFFGISDEEANMPHARAELTLESSLESPFGVSGVDLRLRSSFLSARKNERLVRTSLWVNAHDLTLEGPVYNRSGIVHVLVRAFGVNGAQMEGGIDQFLRVSLNEEGYLRAMKWGLVYSTVIPVPKPGPYQIRAAMLDQASGKIGAANQFLMISNTPARGFQLSGILFPQMLSKEDDITPAFGPAAFGPGQRVPFGFEIVGGADEKSLQINTLLYRDGELVERSPARPLRLAGKSLHGSLFAKFEVAIPERAAPGDYRMRVIVSETAPGHAGRTASQWADLEIENLEAPVKP
jgi:hypothetical protein